MVTKAELILITQDKAHTGRGRVWDERGTPIPFYCFLGMHLPQQSFHLTPKVGVGQLSSCERPFQVSCRGMKVEGQGVWTESLKLWGVNLVRDSVRERMEAWKQEIRRRIR